MPELQWLAEAFPNFVRYVVVGFALAGLRGAQFQLQLLAALTFALTTQRQTVRRIIEMTSTPPPPGASGPPPALQEAVKRVQRGGAFLGIMVVVIVFLMVVRPTV